MAYLHETENLLLEETLSQCGKSLSLVHRTACAGQVEKVQKSEDKRRERYGKKEKTAPLRDITRVFPVDDHVKFCSVEATKGQ
jgi:hypothetical protein